MKLVHPYAKRARRVATEKGHDYDEESVALACVLLILAVHTPSIVRA